MAHIISHAILQGTTLQELSKSMLGGAFPFSARGGLVLRKEDGEIWHAISSINGIRHHV